MATMRGMKSKFSISLFSSFDSFVNIFEHPEINYFFIYCYEGHPSIYRFSPMNPQRPARIIKTKKSVLPIFSWADISKIFDSVVKSVSVNVVNKIFGESVCLYKPDYPMSKVSFSGYKDSPIHFSAIFMTVSGFSSIFIKQFTGSFFVPECTKNLFFRNHFASNSSGIRCSQVIFGEV